MKTKYTKGRWTAVGAWVEHSDDNIADICTCDPSHFAQGHFDRSDEEICANARLIAAAPELLKALKQAVSLLRANHVHPSDVMDFEDVIDLASLPRSL